MRLVVLAHGPALAGRTIERDAPNPGIGGTQFTRLRLAQEFAARFPQHRVEVVSDQDVAVSPRQPNLTVTGGVRFAERLAALAFEDDPWVLTGPSMLLRGLDVAVMHPVADRTIVTSHLMYDADLWEAERSIRFGAVGCVGSHHFQSTRSRAPRTYLRDLFLPGWGTDIRSMPRPTDEGFRIVHVGALLPLKGFHDLAGLWSDIRVAIPRVRLDVIGGSATYGQSASHPLVPTDRVFGDRILDLIPEDDIRSGRVVFHGNLGATKVEIIRSADVAVLNVAGREEALCAALVECLDLGVPVVGSARHGLWDSMRLLSEGVTRDPSEVVPRLSRFAADPALRARASERAALIADGFRAENDVILDRWETVAASLLAGRRPPSFAPAQRSRSRAAHTTEHLRRRIRHELARTAFAGRVREIRRGHPATAFNDSR